MRTPSYVLPVLALLASCAVDRRSPIAIPRPSDSITVAFYNVENLFDPADDPSSEGDDEFTPEGRLRWTSARLDHKLEVFARTVRALHGYTGTDILGVAEVENRNVLDKLVGEYLPEGQYAVAHAESPDRRGIDVALLYRLGALKLLSLVMHHVTLPPSERPTRDIMEATFVRGDRRVIVLVNHWPSRGGGVSQTEPKRLAAARVAAAVIDARYRADPGADIIMLGDLNDEPSDRSLTQILDAAPYRGGAFQHRMISLSAPVEETDTIGSSYFGGSWETIDQILVSRGALDSVGLTLYETSQTIFAPEFLRDRRADARVGPPKRTYAGARYVGGVSDHFPVEAVFGWREVRGERSEE